MMFKLLYFLFNFLFAGKQMERLMLQHCLCLIHNMTHDQNSHKKMSSNKCNSGHSGHQRCETAFGKIASFTIIILLIREGGRSLLEIHKEEPS